MLHKFYFNLLKTYVYGKLYILLHKLASEVVIKSEFTEKCLFTISSNAVWEYEIPLNVDVTGCIRTFIFNISSQMSIRIDFTTITLTRNMLGIHTVDNEVEIQTEVYSETYYELTSNDVKVIVANTWGKDI